MELVELLKSQLGVSDTQASGGAGLLLKLAKDKLGADFSKISGSIPDTDKLLSSAPSAGGIGSLVSSLTGGKSDLGNLASLAGGLKKLNLDPAMISKFVPVILSFAQSKGGDTVKGLLEKVLK
ncbi:MAG: DUF2780 domain-containing protein [Fibrobacter sp.]|nr:DUF2780 domain-containing protein [Fibrobacter sp.]